MASSTSKKQSSSRGRKWMNLYGMEWLLFGLMLAVSYQYLSTHQAQTEKLLGRRARIYTKFGPFYSSLYRKEHANDVNRYLHFGGTTLCILLAINEPRLIPASLLSLGVGLNVFELTLSVPHGLIELAAMILTFLIAGRLLTGSYRPPLGVMLAGYGAAWIGHFFIESNKPATFTYAVYSLMGDFKMWVETFMEIKNAAIGR